MAITSAVLAFGFDATFRFGDLAVRWQTLGIALAVLAGIAWCALIAGRTPIEEPGAKVGRDEGGAARGTSNAGPAAGDGTARGAGAATADGGRGMAGRTGAGAAARADHAVATGADRAAGAGAGGIRHLRRDDLLFIVLGVLPGAVVTGRVGYGLLHADWYGRNWRLLLDPAAGSLELTGAVVGGTLTGIYVAALLDAPVGRWLHVAIRPLLLVLALGKAAEVLGGSGQGALVSDGSSLATAYAGPGPWGSVGAALPAVPSQLLDAVMAVVVIVLVSALGWRSALRRADGRLFAVGIAAWTLGHALVASTWRDAAVLGVLNAEQLICLVVAGVAMLAFVAATLVIGRRRRIPLAAAG